MLECVVNLSEGRDAARIAGLAAAGGVAVLDVHSDAEHNRTVVTLAGPDTAVVEGVRALAAAAVELLDLREHQGVHPRLGVVDVVPWVHLVAGPDATLLSGDAAAAVAERDRFARWAAAGLGLPCFLYGPLDVPSGSVGGSRPGEEDRGLTLPEVRRRAWRDLAPDVGPPEPHPTAGAACVGARGLLVAYNLWLAEPDLALARRVAAAVRAPALRALGLAVDDRVQVSCNLVEPATLGPADAFDRVAALTSVAGAELVGLVPATVLQRSPKHRWSELDLDPSTTIEARLEEAGLDGGRSGGRPG